MKAAIGLLICLALPGALLIARAQKSELYFQPPQVVTAEEPSYPANTVAGGTVVMNVTVSASGEIENVRVLRPAGGFTQPALEAVRKWKFKPASLDGKPVTASIPVAFSFSQPIVWWNRQTR
jgi:TonB family protein